MVPQSEPKRGQTCRRPVSLASDRRSLVGPFPSFQPPRRIFSRSGLTATGFDRGPPHPTLIVERERAIQDPPSYCFLGSPEGLDQAWPSGLSLDQIRPTATP